MTKIKICGIKSSDEVQILNQFPVDYAGFIFAKSKRQVDTKACRKLIKQLRTDINRVGVFVNQPLELVLKAALECELDVIQLHGDETVDYIHQIPIDVWKTIPIRNAESLNMVKIYDEVVEGILFETYHEKLRGGTGEAFDWQLLNSIKHKNYLRIVAGGINPQNAREAIEITQPDILDVNSGVEENGFKTQQKIENLFKELKL